MQQKVILSADSTCDLGEALKARYDVHYFPLHITIDGRDYIDNVDITPPEMFALYRQTGTLPKTSAVNVGEYLEHFERWTKQGMSVVHLNLAASLSSAHANALEAARRAGNVQVIDSRSLSTGTGLLVLAAAERIATGMSAEQVAAEVRTLTPRAHASFIIDTLEFLREGGRCSALTALSASLLSIKPCIEVSNVDGSMSPGRKYRGKFNHVLLRYVQNKLDEYGDSIDDTRVFITHAGVPASIISEVRTYLEEHARFREIYETTASCTISAHCGPNTLGILFMTR
ncbi:MAG: DegV family protein [Coriobacteriales bacterium]|jgi:DegV family protein with EDD domain|nr:DegV family protein [Coriobacteriales bacterium]